MLQRRSGRSEAAAEEHRGALDEAIEDLCDDEGEGEIDKEEDAHANVSEERVDESEENGRVNEVEAVGDLPEVMDRAVG